MDVEPYKLELIYSMLIKKIPLAQNLTKRLSSQMTYLTNIIYVKV